MMGDVKVFEIELCVVMLFDFEMKNGVIVCKYVIFLDIFLKY